jgi:glutathione S-transferase
MLTLYDFGNSVCCQKVRITMCAKGLDWDSVKVDLFKAEQYDPKYLKLNPKGIVPTLVHDGKAIIESTLICEYLDDTFPEPPLIPANSWLRTRMRLWSKMVDEGLFEGVTEISFSAMFRERMRNMPEEIRERRFRNIGDPRRRDRFMRPTNSACVRRPSYMGSRPTSGLSRCWRIRFPKLGRGYLALVQASPTST